MTGARKAAIAILFVIGAIAVATGVVYLTVRANALPSILGHLHTRSHRTKRGYASLGVGVVLLAVAIAMVAIRPKPTTKHRSHSPS